MSTYYVVSYDLSKPGRDYEELHKFLRSHRDWAKVLESVWIVESDLTQLELVNAALKHMDANDHIIVTPYTGVAAWYNISPEVQKWIQKTHVS
ncbi:CRISPR-associated endonuclease Cas2 [Mycolicibacterium rhodesiae]|uniref:SinR family protein n=1 Tax=Mycolicibacterium rhodesiae TaxID=36814 RepID=A0A1X0IRD2_MYCRH|nr:CRISPR-associated endonuclease Cas2 [Mycolicibacterium rhodesiae]MCV7346995.1 CRISPR-associated endonuclease Cas2 [Mycolicibacterium rhodesiae]ORB50943.1 hypothetical protein BST42_18760 [Mycolicibacterium rhodesiae]